MPLKSLIREKVLVNIITSIIILAGYISVKSVNDPLFLSLLQQFECFIIMAGISSRGIYWELHSLQNFEPEGLSDFHLGQCVVIILQKFLKLGYRFVWKESNSKLYLTNAQKNLSIHLGSYYFEKRKHYSSP
jgi:hypothetical protein